MTDAAPKERAVLAQSSAVSPPPQGVDREGRFVELPILCRDGAKEHVGRYDRGVFRARKVERHGSGRSRSRKDGVEFVHKITPCEVLADGESRREAHARVFKELHAVTNDVARKLEGGDPEGEQSARNGRAVDDVDLDAEAHEHVGAGQSRRARSHHRNAAAPCGVAGGGGPSGAQGFVGQGSLQSRDGDGKSVVFPGAGAFAEALRRTDAGRDFRENAGRQQNFLRLLLSTAGEERRRPRHAVS